MWTVWFYLVFTACPRPEPPEGSPAPAPASAEPATVPEPAEIEPEATEPTPAFQGAEARGCAATERYLVPGCGEGAPFAQGCTTMCSADDTTCPSGTVCREVVYHPCVDAPCDACGATAWACVQ